MKKPDVIRLFRQQVDPVLKPLGFQWRRMVGCADGHYVRDWPCGRDTIGFGLASYHPHFRLSGYATARPDVVAALLLPHVGLISPEYATDFFVCHAGFAAFRNGPGGNPNHAWEITTPEDVAAAADEYGALVQKSVDPWLRTLRTLDELSQLPEEWRQVCFGHQRAMVEAALAFLLASPEDAERVFAQQWEDAGQLCEMECERIRALISDLRARKSPPSSPAGESA